MNFASNSLGDRKDPKFGSLKKVNTLNPNAVAFVPSSLKVTHGSINGSVAGSSDAPGSSKSTVLDQFVANTSNISDDEILQYWRHQLPDDITPDFKIGKQEMNKPENLSLASLSLHENSEISTIVTSVPSQIWSGRQDRPTTIRDNFSFNRNMGYTGPTFSELTAFMPSAVSPQGKSFASGETHNSNGREEHIYNDDYSAGLINDLASDSADLENLTINPIDFLSSLFPGFAAQSLADVYYGNGCDLNLTFEMLSQLKLQFDGNFDQIHIAKPLVASSLSLLDSPALSSADSSNGLSKYNGADVQFVSKKYRSPPNMLKGDKDFTSTVKKLSSHCSGHWRDERDSIAGGVGSSGTPILSSSYYGHGKMTTGDKLQCSGGGGASPIWLETGAAGNMYSKLREEARDFARLGSACFEQAHLIGNKTPAKDLNMKDQLYNMQMKVDHEKTKEVIYRQRNPLSAELHGDGWGQDPVIDLLGLHITEAIHVLNQELGILRCTATYTGQRLQVMVCVGTGYQTKGSRSHARLPVVVQQYLLDEGLHFTQPHPGFLRVVI